MIGKYLKFLVGIAFALSVSGAAGAERESFAETILVHAGTLLVTPGKAPLQKQTIVIRDGKIVSVEAGFLDKAPDGSPARLIDLADKFVLPGLMDLHVHLTSNLAAPRTERMLASRKPIALRAFESGAGARRLVLSGFTTIQDLGGEAEIIFPLRDAINSGLIVGPRIFASGPNMATYGGHGRVYCDGVESCRRATRERVAAGADVIKIATSGSASDESGQPGSPAQMMDDEIRAIVDTARQHNRRVVSHAVSVEAINAALRNDVWAIEHGTYADEGSLRLIRERGTFLVPTTYVAEFLNNPAIRAALSPDEWQQLSIAMRATYALPGRAYAAGVTLVLGTDAGNEVSANHARELQLYVESGVPASEALKAATVNAARLLERENSLGQLRTGFVADVIAVDGDPTVDISRMFNVSFVMKDGKVLKRDGQPVIP